MRERLVEEAKRVDGLIRVFIRSLYMIYLDYLQQSSPKIQDPFVLWVALQVKGSILIFSLLQQ